MSKLITGNFTGSVIFVDIRNFLGISDLLTPEEVRKFVLKAIDLLSKCIKDHEGYICQIQGDAILAVFGLRQTKKGHALQAVDCALEIQKILDSLNPVMVANMSIPLAVKIGICSGDMYSCYIKVADHKEFTVLGKTVNLASRYQKLNKHYGTNILIDESVFAYIKKKTATRKLDKVNIDGCSDSIELFEVLFLRKNHDREDIGRRMHYERGFVNYLRGEWDKAIKCFQRVSEDNVYGKMLRKCKELKILLSFQGKDPDEKP